MAQWNDKFLIFNDSIVQESSGSPRWSTVRVAAEDDEVRRKFRSQPLWHLDLSNLQLSLEQYEELLAFQYQVEGMLNPFLVRNVRNYLFEDAKGQPALLGVGNGVNKTFQLQKWRPIQGRTRSVPVEFPNYNYPPLLDLNERPFHDNLTMPELEIRVGGIGLSPGGFRTGDALTPLEMDVERNGGGIEITTSVPAGQRVEAYGGFFTLMLCNEDEIPVSPVRHLFKISKGTGMSEPTDDWRNL